MAATWPVASIDGDSHGFLLLSAALYSKYFQQGSLCALSSVSEIAIANTFKTYRMVLSYDGLSMQLHAAFRMPVSNGAFP